MSAWALSPNLPVQSALAAAPEEAGGTCEEQSENTPSVSGQIFDVIGVDLINLYGIQELIESLHIQSLQIQTTNVILSQLCKMLQIAVSTHSNALHCEHSKNSIKEFVPLVFEPLNLSTFS